MFYWHPKLQPWWGVRAKKHSISHAFGETYLGLMKRWFSAVFQTGGIDVLKSSPNFCHLFLSMRETFPENMSFTTQFNLFLWLFKISEICPKLFILLILFIPRTPNFIQPLLLVIPKQLRGSSLLFTTKFPEIPGTHLIDLGSMKGWIGFGAIQCFWFWTRGPWIRNPAP